MASMKFFNTIDEFLTFSNQLDIYNGWKIEKGFMNDRGAKIKDKTYFIELKALFNSRNLFRRSVSIAEVVSWLDSIVILKRICIKLKQNLSETIYSKISIEMEYKIEYSKLMRVDFVLYFDQKLLLLEYRMVDGFNKIKPTWQKKKQELLVYKELLENYIDSTTKIYTYAMITVFENEKSRQVKKNIEFNNNQVNHFVRYFIDLVTTPSIRCII